MFISFPPIECDSLIKGPSHSVPVRCWFLGHGKPNQFGGSETTRIVWSFTSTTFRYTGNVWSFTSTTFVYRGTAIDHGAAVN